jgi:hypothetical protein
MNVGQVGLTAKHTRKLKVSLIYNLLRAIAIPIKHLKTDDGYRKKAAPPILQS